jgi:hypothetical protein
LKSFDDAGFTAPTSIQSQVRDTSVSLSRYHIVIEFVFWDAFVWNPQGVCLFALCDPI